MNALYSVVVLLVLAVVPLSGQLHVLRTVFVQPSGDSTREAGAIASTAFLGELQRGSGSLGGEQAWNIKIGGMAELYRWSASSLVFTAMSELTANAHNDIGFNPRTATWEEQLFFVHRPGAWMWQGGVFHRCKHEIDNTDPPNADTLTPGYQPTKRVLITSGIQAGTRFPVLPLAEHVMLQSYLRGEWYIQHLDYRIPDNDSGRSWQRLRGTVMAGGKLAAVLAKSTAVYVRAWGAGMLFAAEPKNGRSSGMEFHARAELGATLTGKGGALDVFIAYERLFDEPVFIVPQSSSVVFVGIRVRAMEMW